MDRDKAAGTNLLDREEKIVTDILSGFRDLVIHGSEQVNNAASAGQAAFNSMTLNVTMNGLVKSTEDLLQLTRKLRELWVVGPLRLPGEGDTEAGRLIESDAAAILRSLSELRDQARSEMARQSDGVMTYSSGLLDAPPNSLPAPPDGPNAGPSSALPTSQVVRS